MLLTCKFVGRCLLHALCDSLHSNDTHRDTCMLLEVVDPLFGNLPSPRLRPSS